MSNDLARYLVYLASASLLLAGNAGAVRTTRTGGVLRVAGYAVLLVLLYGWYLEVLPLVLLLVSVITASLVTLYTSKYAQWKYRATELLPLVDFFTFATALVFTSKYLIELVAFWLVAEVLGFFVVVYDAMVGVNQKAWSAGLRYLVVSMVPADLSLLLLLALAGLEKAFTVPLTAFSVDLSSGILTVLAMLGFLAKAAVAPLHFWLPDAHSIAPAPGSAVLSGLMVKMGIYGLARLALMGTTSYWVAVASSLVFGSLTSIYGGLQALVQSDIKRILAYSTISHTSTMTMLLGLYMLSGSEIFMAAATLYAAAHAVYKASLFMDSGVVELLAHTRTLERLGFVSRVIPGETLSALIAVLSLIGVPPTLGFLNKLVMFMALAGHIPTSWIYLVVTVVVAFELVLSIGYSARYLLSHMGSPSLRHGELNTLSARLTPYVLSLSASSVVLAFPVIVLMLPTLLAELFTQILALVVIFAVLFAATGWATYAILRRGRRDEVWLGGARP